MGCNPGRASRLGGPSLRGPHKSGRPIPAAGPKTISTRSELTRLHSCRNEGSQPATRHGNQGLAKQTHDCEEAAAAGGQRRSLEIFIRSELISLLIPRHHVGLLVLPDTLLEKISLPLQGDQLHPVEGVGDVEDLAVAQGDQEPISHKFDVTCHHHTVHSNQVAGQRLTDKFPLHIHSLTHDLMHDIFRQLVSEHAVEQAGEIRVQPLVTGDHLIRERQTRHQPPLLEPENSAEGSTEQNPLHGSEANEPLSEAVLVIHPLHCPGCLLCDRGHLLNSIEKVVLLHRILDILFNQQGIRLRMNIFHRDLKPVKSPSLRQLDFTRKLGTQVLQHNPV
mmetsp:Transcript_51441/g.112776  ORF Transcript_51441/g.112776 Transcript_51441/m.112776 type:complete len:335 (+) Transcript_51441:158-1162(+)